MKASLKRMLAPQSIAVIGASENKSYGGRLMKNLLSHGYKGALYPINPKYKEIFGQTAYPSLESVDKAVDLAILILRADLIPDLLEQCERKKVGAVLIISAGFKEEGTEEGEQREKWVKRWSKRTGIPVCGPNCLGIQSQAVNMCASAASSIGATPTPSGSTGLISHSGATAFGPLLNRGKDIGTYFRYIVSTGNEADCTMTDYADAMLDDPEITAVALFVEGIKDGAGFIRLAEKALSFGKPLVVMKIGESEVGQRAAASHTASMTGNQDVFKALCRQKAILHVHDYEELLSTLLCWNQKKQLSGKRLAVFSHSGGMGGFISDRLGVNGFEIPPFRKQTVEKIDPLNKGFGSSQNPLDLSGTMQTEGMPAIFEMLEKEETIDGYVFATHGKTPLIERLIRLHHSAEKPVYLLWTGSRTDPLLEELRAAAIPVFLSVNLLTSALKHVKYFSEKTKVRVVAELEMKPEPISDSYTEEKTLTEREGKILLQSAGIETPKSYFFSDKEDVAARIGEIDFTDTAFAGKIVSRSITHKSDRGGVALHLSAASQVMDFCETAAMQFPADQIEGFLFEEMIEDKAELILGSSPDDTFGQVILLGFGGIYTELFKLVTWRVAPVNRREAEEMIHEVTGLGTYLQGFRGSPQRDVEALITAVVRFSRFVYGNRETIQSVEINPLAVLSDGVRALDCVIQLQ